MRRGAIARIRPAALLMGLACLPGGSLAQAQESAAQAPIQVESVTLEHDDDGTTLVLTAGATLEWNVTPNARGELLIELPGTYPGPEVESRSFDDLLVHRVEIWADIGPDSVATRLLLEVEPGADHWVTQEGGRLTITFTPGEDRPPIRVPAPPPAGRPAAPPSTVQPSTAAVEEAAPRDLGADLLAENRRLASELQRALTRNAELAAAVETAEAARTAELERRRGEAAAANEADARRIAQLERQLEELRDEAAAANAGHAAEAQRELAEQRRLIAATERERDRLAARVTELEAAAGQAGARDRRSTAERDAARAELEAVQLAAAQRVAELEGRLAGLRGESEAARSRAAELAETLALGGTTYRVRQDVRPCLNLRREARRDAARVDCLAPGTELTVVEVVDEWRRARLADGSEGWAAGEYLDPAPVSRAEMERLTAERDAARAEAAAAREERTADLAAAQAEIGALRAGLDAQRAAARKELDAARSRLSGEHAAVEARLAAELDAARREAAALDSELAALRLDERAARVAETAEKIELQARIDRLEEELARLRQR